MNSNVEMDGQFIKSIYQYDSTKAFRSNKGFVVIPERQQLEFQTERNPKRVGVMLIGWGGNNGTTFTAALEANRQQLKWQTKNGTCQANWLGSITQASTVFLGTDEQNNDVFAPMKAIVPLLEPNDIHISGWDINAMNIGDAMKRAQVLDVNVQNELYEKLQKYQPRPSIYDKNYIAINQSNRVDNCLTGNKYEQFLEIKKDIRNFKEQSQCELVILLWTANTERNSTVQIGINTTMCELETTLKDETKNDAISPSTIFAMAAMHEKCIYINGSPQNTFVPGVLEMADYYGGFLVGDDFKSGQTKVKTVLMDFLINAGIKPKAIVSYNHLGNNDGLNLSEPDQFASKAQSKGNVIDDIVQSNDLLYKKDEKPDHCVVIKYVPYVGDSKRALDEYTSELMMGGHNTLILHNTCEDSLLAAPLMLDMIVLAELCLRIKVTDLSAFVTMQCKPILSMLNYLCKAPQGGSPMFNSLFRQRTTIENILRACIGLAPINNMYLNEKILKMK